MSTRVSPEARKLALYLIETYDRDKSRSSTGVRLDEDGLPVPRGRTETTARDRKLDRDELKLSRFADIDALGVRDELVTAGELATAIDALPAATRAELDAAYERGKAAIAAPPRPGPRDYVSWGLMVVGAFSVLAGALMGLGPMLSVGGFLGGIGVAGAGVVAVVAGAAILPKAPDHVGGLLAAFEQAFGDLPA